VAPVFSRGAFSPKISVGSFATRAWMVRHGNPATPAARRVQLPADGLDLVDELPLSLVIGGV